MASLNDELKHILARDPAARTRLEVALTYPGFHALVTHRAAHYLWRRNLKLVARLIAAFTRLMTGVEIHPAAVIGAFCFIDHGQGVVIGETAIIGERVTLYHEVTLGGTSLNSGKRHPTLGDDVIVGAGAKLLGPITIGSRARIGANAVVVKDVEEGASMVGIPARVVEVKSDEGFTAYGTPVAGDNDPTVHDMVALQARVTQLEARLAQFGGAAQPPSATFDA
ncbi:MAG: serine O-acetyltransferase [Pseudomonadota bacterium]